MKVIKTNDIYYIADENNVNILTNWIFTNKADVNKKLKEIRKRDEHTEKDGGPDEGTGTDNSSTTSNSTEG